MAATVRSNASSPRLSLGRRYSGFSFASTCSSEQDLRASVEAQHRGKLLVLDIETGEYEIDTDDLAATRRALAKRPDAVLYGLRIGSPAAYRIGTGSV